VRCIYRVTISTSGALMWLSGKSEHRNIKSSISSVADIFCSYRNYLLTYCICRPCHSSGGQSPASHCGVLGSSPGQVMWDLWWRTWHWDKFPSSTSVSLPILIPLMLRTHHHHHHLSSGAGTIGQLLADVPSGLKSHSTSNNQSKKKTTNIHV
jgi:hypothetical protein